MLKLLEEQPQRKASIEKKRQNSGGRSINGMTASHPLKRIERNKSLTFNGKSSMISELKSKVDDRNSTIDRQLTHENKRSRKPSEKSKSDFDLTSLPMDQPFENLRLPPPQEFRDGAPLPPDQFRDPPSLEDDGDEVEEVEENNERKNDKENNNNDDDEEEEEEEEEEEISEKLLPTSKAQQKPSVTATSHPLSHVHQPVSQQNSNQITTSSSIVATATTTSVLHPQAIYPIPKPPQQIIEAIDNPLYHVYEIKRMSGPPRQFCKSQSSNELITMVRAASVNDKLISHHNHLKNQLSKPNSPAQNSDRSDSINNDEERVAPPLQLMEFEKCREEFRKQINYSGSIYSDFKSFASDMSYFNISDEYRTFSPAGVHLIVCVHGLDGNSADLRLVRTYLELGLPGAHLEFL